MELTMRRMLLALVILLLVPTGLRADQARARADGQLAAGGSLASAGILAAADPLFAEAPAPWDLQDPADSLYRSAREAMNRGEHARSAMLFRQIWERHPRSTYAPDALYWEAFNRYRLGDTHELERALELLELQRDRYGKAATRENGDARSLESRIRGQLARRGNADAAQAVVASANAVAGLAAGVGAEMGDRMEAMAAEVAAQGEIMAEELARMAQEGAAVGAAMGAAIARGMKSGVPEECRDEVDTQLAALNALIHMDADRALPVLTRVMERRDECAAPVRRRAIFMIADQSSPAAVDLLLEAARSDPDLEVRRQAVFWLSEVDDPRAVAALQSIVAQSEDEQIRERAIFALSQHDSPEARRILRGVTGDRSMPAALRGKAIYWLGMEGGAEDVDFLKGMFGRLDDPRLDERILVAVGQAERHTDASWLLSVASNDSVDPRLRRTAIFWAAEAGAPAAALGSLYDRLTDRALKERIIFGLSESHEPAALDKLIDIARTEKDSELRNKAIFWLGNSDDARAADILMELLMGGGGGR